jgi:hypothetical protein
MGLRKKVKVFRSSLRYSRRNISLNEEGEPNLGKKKEGKDGMRGEIFILFWQFQITHRGRKITLVVNEIIH